METPVATKMAVTRSAVLYLMLCAALVQNVALVAIPAVKTTAWETAQSIPFLNWRNDHDLPGRSKTVSLNL